MLDFDFDDIDEALDSDNDSVILYGKKKKSKRLDVSQLSTEEANALLAQYHRKRKAFTEEQNGFKMGKL